MFDLDHFHEILQTLRRNPLRTFLTACGIFWGVFMLVVMLGMGRGLEKGVLEDFGFYAMNTRYFWGEETTKPFAGRQVGRHVYLKLEDIEVVNQIAGVQVAFGRSQRQNQTAWRDANSLSVTVSGDYPEVLLTENSEITRGRFLNGLDMQECRRVAVIGSLVQETLFKSSEDPIGQTIRVAGTQVVVVGVLEASITSPMRREYYNSRVFLPHPIFAGLFKTGNRLGNLMLLVDQNKISAPVEEEIVHRLKVRHHVAPEDDRAIRMFTRDKAFHQLMALFQAIQALSWVVGTLTLLAGAIGVSNIMMIAVAERSREIGIRKAVGATPFSIIVQIVTESTLLTALAGYLGLVAGVGALELVTRIMMAMPTTGQGPSFFSAPELDLGRALVAAGFLTVAGGLAGLAPARAAAAVRPIEALAHE